MADNRPPDERLPYLQILDELRRAIVRGEIEPGGRLPSNAELKRKYQVASQTAQNAINALKSEGLVYGVAGRGVFVRLDLDLDALRATAIADEPEVSNQVLDGVLAQLSSLTSKLEAFEDRMAYLEQKVVDDSHDETEATKP